MNGGGHHMTYVRKKGRRFWLPAGLSILAAALAATMWVTVAAGRSSTSTASTIKIAILSDCQGAFASNYEQDIGGGGPPPPPNTRGRRAHPPQAPARSHRAQHHRPPLEQGA